MAKKTKSIMQDKESGQCYLCRLLHNDYGIKRIREEHHVMGGVACKFRLNGTSVPPKRNGYSILTGTKYHFC